VYCVLAFAGFSGLFELRTVQAAMELISFLLVLWLGIKYLRVGRVPGEARVEEFVERRFHPTGAFFIGFARVLGNPGVLLLWVGITGSLLAHHALEPVWSCKGSFVAAVSVSSLIWFAAVGWGVARGQGRFSSKFLRKLSKTSGVALLVTAAIIGFRLVGLLARK
jgi:threonine/homoserine/homoserine lactone efflux protein